MYRFAVVALFAALPWTASAFQSDFNWTGTLSPGQKLEIKGVNGSIRAELAPGPAIEVTARKTANRSDPASVRIEVVPGSEGVTICSVYPGEHGSNACGGQSDIKDNDVNVDYTVKLPAGIVLAARTVNGGVTAKGLRSDVHGSSVNGNVHIDTSGFATAKSVNGSLDVAIGNSAWSGSLDFKTVNGSIDLTLPAAASAEVHASSLNGSLHSDFPLTMNGRIERRNINARIGAGGRELNLKTVNGGITLHQANRA